MGRLATKGTRFEWNGSSSAIAGRKGFGADLNRYCAEVLYEHSEKYTPEKTGLMIRDVRISGNKERGMITYYTKYVKYQHDKPFNHPKPLATDHWEQAAALYEAPQMISEINKYRREHSK